MFFIAVALMSSIGEIWWEEKKTQTNKQTNKTSKLQHLRLLFPFAREPRAKGNRRRLHVGSICCSSETKIN